MCLAISELFALDWIMWHFDDIAFTLIFRYNFNALQRSNEALKKNYGALGLSVSHVIYTNGRLDPWNAHGILYSNDPQNVVLNIEGTQTRATHHSFECLNLKYTLFDTIPKTTDTRRTCHQSRSEIPLPCRPSNGQLCSNSSNGRKNPKHMNECKNKKIYKK